MQPDEQLDPDAVRLTKSLALAESGDGGTPNYSAVGDKGTSKGAYQWNNNNFQEMAKSHGLDPNDFSPENQNRVAYYQVKADKDAGLSPAEIAAKWNSGNPNNWKDHKGINAQGIAYDTPAYVDKVRSHYENLASQEMPQTAPTSGDSTQVAQPTNSGNSDAYSGDYSQNTQNQGSDAYQYPAQEQPAQQDGGLLAKLAGRWQDAMQGAKQLVMQGTPDQNQGEYDTSSRNKQLLYNAARVGEAPLRIAGAVGGAISDVVGAVAKPLFHAIGNVGESALQSAGVDTEALKQNATDFMGNAFSEPHVQKAVGAFNQLAQEYPDQMKDAGAAYNVFTSLIPAAKTAQAVKALTTAGVATELARTQEGATLLQQAKKEGVDIFKPLSEAAVTAEKNAGGKEFAASLLDEPIQVAREKSFSPIYNMLKSEAQALIKERATNPQAYADEPAVQYLLKFATPNISPQELLGEYSSNPEMRSALMDFAKRNGLKQLGKADHAFIETDLAQKAIKSLGTIPPSTQRPIVSVIKGFSTLGLKKGKSPAAGILTKAALENAASGGRAATAKAMLPELAKVTGASLINK